jgi:iron complex outermembrane receptor protein
MMNAPIITIFLTLLCSLSFGQKAFIGGKVTDATTGEAMPGASISWQPGKGSVSNEMGNFGFHLPAGERVIQIQYMGYKPVIEKLTMLSGDSVWLTIAMEHEFAQIDQVVVSAGRAEQRVAESTVSMSIIRPAQISSGHINNAQELINRSPGIEVIDGQASVRGGSGFSYGAGSRVLTLLDGLPILAADASNIRWQFLPFENIEQIEIIKGASSVLYGSSALNGVINFRTARATDAGRTTFFAETGLFDSPRNPEWQWWESSNPRLFLSGSFSHLKKYNNTDLGIGLFGLKDDGYRKLNHENLGRINLSVHHENQKIAGMEYGINALIGCTDKRDFLLWENAGTGALRQNDTTAINLRSTFIALDPFFSFDTGGMINHNLRTRFQMSDNKFPDATNNESLALSAFAEYQAEIKLTRIININTGISQYVSRVTSRFYGNHSAYNLAAYSQADVKLNEKMTMVGGVRLELNSLNGLSDQPVPLLRAGINYMALSHTFLRASYGQGYRYPSIAEKHAATTLGAIRIFPNPGIKPESGWNAELGVKQGISVNNWDGLIDVALFYSQNKDMIEYLFGVYPDPVSGISSPGFRADNTEYSRVYGGETEFMFIKYLNNYEHTISGGYLFVFPVEFSQISGLNTDVYLKYRRKHSARISFQTRRGNIETGADLFYRSAMLNIDDVFINPGTRKTILPGFYSYWQENNTGYFLLDVNFGYHINKFYKISLAVKNLTNTEYMGRPGDIRPHRNFSIRISTMF